MFLLLHLPLLLPLVLLRHLPVLLPLQLPTAPAFATVNAAATAPA
jgi:hypothetical protein